jgi:hypothetical protein
MKRTCGTGGKGGRREKIGQEFWWEQPRRDNNFEDVGIDGRVVSK